MEESDPTKSVFEVFLTPEYQRVINDCLPKGYSLQFSVKPNRREALNARASKKVQLDGGNYTRFESSASNDFHLHKQSSYILEKKKNSHQASYAAVYVQAPAAQVLPQTQLQQQQQPLNLHQSSIYYPQQQLPLLQYNSLQQSSVSVAAHQSPHNSMSQSGHISKHDSTHAGGTKNGAARNKRAKEARPQFETEQQYVLTDEMKKCYYILYKLKKNSSAFPFMQPVDPVQQKCLDYFDIVKEPIDLSAVENNFKEGHYSTPSQFAADVRKIWSNSYLYNYKNSHIYLLTKDMDYNFEKLFKEVEQPTIIYYPSSHSVEMLKKQVDKLTKELKELNNSKKTNSKSKKYLVVAPRYQYTKFDVAMTMAEKRYLGYNIRSLPPEHLRGVWEIVSDGTSGQHMQEELEFDIDTLPVRKTRQLENYVKSKLAQIKKLKSNKKNVAAGGYRMEKYNSYISNGTVEPYTPTQMLTPGVNTHKITQHFGANVYTHANGYQLSAKGESIITSPTIAYQVLQVNSNGTAAAAVVQAVNSTAANTHNKYDTDESDASSFISDSE